MIEILHTVDGSIDEQQPGPAPYYSGPGPQNLIRGDYYGNGFFGEVPVEELITGNALASSYGLTAGTAFNSNEPWLKFVYKGTIYFVAKKPYRYGLSWNQLHDSGLRNSTAFRMFAGHSFRARLFNGYPSNTEIATGVSDPASCYGADWNQLMYRVCFGGLPVTSGEGIRYGEWARYSHADLGLTGNGRLTWCFQGGGLWWGATRGGQDNVRWAHSLDARNATAIYGWRPVLVYRHALGTPFRKQIDGASLITNTDLSNAIGLTEGTLINPNEMWLEYNVDGVPLYIARKSFRHSITWDHLNDVGAVDGSATVEINGSLFKVRLLTDHEWDTLFSPLSITRPEGIPMWCDYPLSTLGFASSGNGRVCWVQDSDPDNPDMRIRRGAADLAYRDTLLSNTTTLNTGWRPVLEKIV